MSRLIIVSILCCLSPFAWTETKTPNVLFIIADDLTAEALSCYGNIQSPTPILIGWPRVGFSSIVPTRNFLCAALPVPR